MTIKKIVNTFRAKNGKLEESMKIVPKELNILRANEKIKQLETEIATSKSSIPPGKNSYNPVYDNGKSMDQIHQEALTKSNLAALKREQDSEKKEKLISAILKDPRLQHFGRTDSIEAIEAEIKYLEDTDSAKKRYESTIAAQENAKRVEKIWQESNQICSAPIYKIIKQKYSLCYDWDGGLNERVFINVDSQNKWHQLVQTGHKGSVNSVGSHSDATPLTRKEFFELLEKQPSIDNLMAVYSLKFNYNVDFEGNEIINIW